MFSIKRLWFIVLLLSPTARGQIISTVAGGGTSGLGDGGPATVAEVSDPHGGVFDKYGNLYIAEGTGHRIRRVDVMGIITTVAGTGISGYNGDGIPATSANITPNAVTVDSIGNLYITDSALIRKIDITTGLINTIAGGGAVLTDGGPASAARFQVPWGICFDKQGNLYFGDVAGYKVRKINTLGIISTVVGNGILGFGGDGGPATAAQCSEVLGVCVDNIGNIYIADGTNNERVRKIDTFGIITTVAGNGTYTYSGDTIPATDAHIDPLDVRVDADGNLYIDDLANDRIRKVNSSGIIYTIAGTGTAGYNGDNILADTAEIHVPGGLALDACGDIYFGDIDNGRFRKVTYPPILTVPTISLSSIVTAPAGTTVTVTATVANAGNSYTIYWMNHGVEFSTTTVPVVTYNKPPGIDTITAKIVPTGYGCWDSTTSARLVVSTPSGVSNLPANEGLLIYPNPATSILNIAMYGAAVTQATISNVFGQVVEASPRPSPKEREMLFDVSSLPAGIYFVKVNGIYVQKFIKE